MRFLRTAYILLWFPKPSETFIFNEVAELARMGLPLSVYTLYGPFPRDLSPQMTHSPVPVRRLGIPFLKKAHSDLLYWLRRNPTLARELLRTILIRRWCDFEAAAENCWAFLCGFRLARCFEKASIEHIHAPWANGPATAAWVASRLTGIPFSFAAHAADIYPPDGALEEKIRDSILVRAENLANVAYLKKYAHGRENKIHAIYSGHPLDGLVRAAPLMRPPFNILALGRFVPKKGFDVLIRACAILRKRGLAFHLTLGGWGPLAGKLIRLAKELNLRTEVRFPGFIAYDKVPEFLRSGDLFVMPSIIDSSGDRDGIPNVIVEALWHGLPVVATDVCGIPEVIRSGETGLLVPQGNPCAIADAVLKIIQNPECAFAMAERGRSLTLQLFDLHRNCRKLLQLFDEQVPANSGGRSRAAAIANTAMSIPS